MNEKKLKDNLNSAKLIIGDIKHTVNPFKKKQLTHPIGFVAFDLDYYSSKIASFEIFKINDDLLLPRIECYMDDVSSTELLVASKGTGVLKAISDFNNKEKKYLGKQMFLIQEEFHRLGIKRFMFFTALITRNIMILFQVFNKNNVNA